MATLTDLTPRETEVLQLIITGQTNKAIATKICVSEKTVEFHLDHIYTKKGNPQLAKTTIFISVVEQIRH